MLRGDIKMTKSQKREDIQNRFNMVISERNIYLDNKESQHYKKLSEIAKLILNEYTVGNHPRHVMYMTVDGYGYRCE
jgi:hypothetical protein